MMNIAEFSIVRLSENSYEVRAEKELAFWIQLRIFLEKELDGCQDVINTQDSVAVFFNKNSRSYLEKLLSSLEGFAPGQVHRKVAFHEIAVTYTDIGTDLNQLSNDLNVSIEQIITWHMEKEYTISMYGFTPGFAYLTGLDKRLQVPRKSDVSKRVKAGSVAIANNYTGVYPYDMSGGWHIIGHTEDRLFDPSRDLIQPFSVGDKVRFRRID